MTGWRPLLLWREGLSNLSARRLQSLVIVALIGAFLLGVAASDTLTAASVQHQETALVGQGLTTVEVLPPPNSQGGSSGIPAVDCARLNGQVGILAAGGVASQNNVYSSSSPALGFAMANSVGNVAGALAGQRQTADGGLLLSSFLANELGVETGDYLKINGQIEKVAQVAPLGQRIQEFGRIALNPIAPAGSVTGCYVQFKPGLAKAVVADILGAFPNQSRLEVGQLVTSGSGGLSPAAQWKSRPTTYLWLAVGLLLGAIMALWSRIRRNELAVYLLTGSRRLEVALIRLVEIYSVAVGGLAIALAWAALIAFLSHGGWPAARAGLVSLAKAFSLVLALAPLGLAWLLRRDTATLLKQRTN